ncbi:hypothetical protein LSAT2_011592 [Lamellibrachia satsuma]|nr:hypothetical protein LSAT2_011592 [Lamellibrachia satsuma]
MVHCVSVDIPTSNVHHLARLRLACRLPNSVRRHRRKCHHSTQLPVNAITPSQRKRADSANDRRLCVNGASYAVREPGRLPSVFAIGPVVKAAQRDSRCCLQSVAGRRDDTPRDGFYGGRLSATARLDKVQRFVFASTTLTGKSK